MMWLETLLFENTLLENAGLALLIFAGTHVSFHLYSFAMETEALPKLTRTGNRILFLCIAISMAVLVLFSWENWTPGMLERGR